jgi:hypothetical protein
MDLDGLVQGVVSNAVWWTVVLVGGAVLAVLRAKWPRYAGPVLYGLLGIASLAIIGFAILGHSLLSREQPQTTPENVEANIRAWADSFVVGVTKAPVKEAHFALVITLHNGNPVVVARTKDRPNWLALQSTLTLSPEHQAAMAKLSKAQADTVVEELTLELARSKMGYELSGPPPLQSITLSRAVPITSNLTEDAFAGQLDQMDSAMQLVRVALTLSLERKAQEKIK